MGMTTFRNEAKFSQGQKGAMVALGYLSPISFLILNIVAIIPLLFIYGLSLDIPVIALLLATVAGELLCVGIACLVVYLFKGNNTQTTKSLVTALGFSKQAFKWKYVAFGLAVGVLMFLGLQGAALVASALGYELESSETSKMLTTGSGFGFYFTLMIMVPLVVPFVEELVFRGYAMGFLLYGHADSQNRSLKSFKNIAVVVFVAMFFAMVHIQGFGTFTDFFLLGWIFILSVVLGIIRLKTDSIWTSVAAHCAYNGSTAIIALLATLL